MAQRTTSKGGAGKAASKASVREAASNGPVGDGIDPRRKAALDSALEQVEKSFGKGSAMRLGDKPEQNVEVIPTGSLALDLALGIGGSPKGASSRSMALNRPARRRWRYMWSPTHRRTAGWRHSSMPSTRWIRSMPGIWVSTPIP